MPFESGLRIGRDPLPVRAPTSGNPSHQMTTRLAIQGRRWAAAHRSVAGAFLFRAGLSLWLILMGVCAPALAAAGLGQNLSEEERAWIARHPVVRVATSADYGPFTFVEQGKVIGMSIDYLDRLHELTGIEFKIEEPASFQNNLQRIGSGEVDVMMSLRDTPERRSSTAGTDT
jgi:hypothetical protein